jgi:hypothetical protein
MTACGWSKNLKLKLSRYLVLITQKKAGNANMKFGRTTRSWAHMIEWAGVPHSTEMRGSEIRTHHTTRRKNAA